MSNYLLDLSTNKASISTFNPMTKRVWYDDEDTTMNVVVGMTRLGEVTVTLSEDNLIEMLEFLWKKKGEDDASV